MHRRASTLVEVEADEPVCVHEILGGFLAHDSGFASVRGADLQRVNELWITSLSASRWDHDHDHGRSNKDTQFAAGRALLSAHESRTYMSKDGQLG